MGTLNYINRERALVALAKIMAPCRQPCTKGIFLASGCCTCCGAHYQVPGSSGGMFKVKTRLEK